MLKLEDYLQTNPSPLPSMVRGGITQYKCPNCGNFRAADIIVDVRSLPILEEWACDGCWTDWHRKGRNVDGLPNDPTDRRDWMIRWAAVHGEPAAVIQNLSLLKRPDKYNHRK